MSAVGPSRRAAIVATVLGLATFAVFIAFTLLPEVQAAQKACQTGASTLTQFQLARSAQDILAVFRAPDDACRAPVTAAMNAMNRLDLYAFIATYGLFLLAVIAMLAGSWRAPLAVAAMLVTFVALGGDVLETWTQLQIGKAPDEPQHFLQPLAIGAWTKYGGLAVAGFLIACIGLQGNKPRWIISVLGLLSGAATIMASINPGFVQFMSLSLAAFWVSLLVVSIWTAVRPSRPAAGAAA